MSAVKTIERGGRRWLIRTVGRLFAVTRAAVLLTARPSILVVRLDERLGNLLLLTPLLDSLRARFAGAELDILVNRRGIEVLSGHRSVSHLLPFSKWALFCSDGPVGTLQRLRKRRYDLVIDAANPTDPSTTQALLVRFSGARHTIGADQPGFGSLYTAPAAITPAGQHEIALRLQLLVPAPGNALCSGMSVPPLFGRPEIREFAASLNASPFVVVNVGARLTAKQLPLADYEAIAVACVRAGLRPVVAYGPGEQHVAEALLRSCKDATLAPPTTVADLATLISASVAVISCDTGPMHLAVALGTPTCAIFVCTDPVRFGHFTPPHRVLDARNRSNRTWLDEIGGWLTTLSR